MGASLLNVSDIQRFSVGDGPGIRSTVFLKGCNLHCPWCHNPETVSPRPQVLDYPNANKKVSYGVRMTVDEVLSDVLEDMDFYRASGGGVTVSGGEPMLQASAVAELCAALGKNGVHVIIDTAGNVPWQSFALTRDVTDCYYFDWKTPDADVYRETVGADPDLVAGNLVRLIAAGKDVHVRIPLIPGINDTDLCAHRFAAMLRGFAVKQVDLLPFHRLASGKYEAMGLTYAYRNTLPPSRDRIAQIAEILSADFTVTTEK